MGKTVNIGGRIHNPEVGNVVAGANEILDDTKGKKQNVINSEVDTALAGLDSSKQDKLTFDQTPTESSTNPVTSDGVYAADQVLQQAIEAILLLIPSAASALNQLADKSFVNSSIATASATFRGTYNLVSDLHLSVSASHQDIATALASVVATADNNDYCFVQVPTSDTSSDIRVTERYKFNGTAWQYEYDLNNSGFTAQQWAAINSTITSALVGKLSALPTADELAALLAGKQATLTFDSTPTPGSANPVTSGGLYDKFEAIIAKLPSDASANNKLVAENRLAAYVGAIVGALDATFDLTSTDGHVTLKITQTDGLIASVQVLTSDIASAQALTTLSGQVSTNASDIATLQDLYNALLQSAPEIIEPTDTWPVANPSDTVIYRVIDRENTPPEYYSDYMWNGTAMVLMATYNNAIDPRPKKGSANLVTSGGVFDNIGALDISELNATGGNLATYATLAAALAAIPSDYQKGGMSIKFVSSVDNKYVQYRLMSDTFNTTIANWQGVDKTPVKASKNFVESGGVYDVEADKNAIKEKLTLVRPDNIFDKNDIITGAIDTDGYTIKVGSSWDNYFSSGYIDVSAYNTIYSFVSDQMGITVYVMPLKRVFLYDNNFLLIGSMLGDESTFNVSSASYMRISNLYGSSPTISDRLMLTASSVAPSAYIPHVLPYYKAEEPFVKDVIEPMIAPLKITGTNVVYATDSVVVDSKGAKILKTIENPTGRIYSLRIKKITGNEYVNTSYIQLNFTDSTNQKIFSRETENVFISAYLDSYGKEVSSVVFYVYPFLNTPSTPATYMGIVATEGLDEGYKYIQKDISAENITIPAASLWKRSNTVNTICHRGYALLAPENSASSIKEARKHGFWGVEGDMQITKDGRYVMWHDSALGKLGTIVYDMDGRVLYMSENNEEAFFYDEDTTKLYKFVDGVLTEDTTTDISTLHIPAGNTLSIQDFNLVELKSLNMFGWFGASFKDEQILTFEEWIVICRQYGLVANIDKKFNYITTYGEQAADKIAEVMTIVRRANMLRHCIWNCSAGELTIIGNIDGNAICRYVVAAASQYFQPNTEVSIFLASHPWQLQFCPSLDDVTEESCRIALDNKAIPSFYLITETAPDSKHINPIAKSKYDLIWQAVGWGCQDITIDCLLMEEVINYKLS